LPTLGLAELSDFREMWSVPLLSKPKVIAIVLMMDCLQFQLAFTNYQMMRVTTN